MSTAPGKTPGFTPRHPELVIPAKAGIYPASHHPVRLGGLIQDPGHQTIPIPGGVLVLLVAKVPKTIERK